MLHDRAIRLCSMQKCGDLDRNQLRRREKLCIMSISTLSTKTWPGCRGQMTGKKVACAESLRNLVNLAHKEIHEAYC